MSSGHFGGWGWDSAVAVNEETEDRTRTPGRAAVISTVLLLVIFAVVTTAAQAFAGAGGKGIGPANPDNSGDVLSGLGTEVFGSTGFGWFLVFRATYFRQGVIPVSAVGDAVPGVDSACLPVDD